MNHFVGMASHRIVRMGPRQLFGVATARGGLVATVVAVDEAYVGDVEENRVADAQMDLQWDQFHALDLALTEGRRLAPAANRSGSVNCIHSIAELSKLV